MGHHQPATDNEHDFMRDNHSLVLTSAYLDVTEDNNETKWPDVIDTVELVTFTYTYFKSSNDLRLQIGLGTIKLLKSKAIPCAIVDYIQYHISIKELMINAGAIMVQNLKKNER